MFHVPLGQFPKPITQCLLIRFKDEFAVYPLLTRCQRHVSRVGLRQTAHSWANTGVVLGSRVRRRVAFETIKLFDANEINFHPNIAQINMQGASVLVLTLAPTITVN